MINNINSNLELILNLLSYLLSYEYKLDAVRKSQGLGLKFLAFIFRIIQGTAYEDGPVAPKLATMYHSYIRGN